MSGKEKLSKNFSPLEIREDLNNYLEKLNVDLEPGRFRFCEKGGKNSDSWKSRTNDNMFCN